MTDDDTKFERARRERPVYEAVGRIVRESVAPPSPGATRPHQPVDMAEMLARWAALDELRGPQNDGEPPPGR